MAGARIGVTCLGVIGRKPAGLTMPGGPRGRTCCPGAAALGLAPGLLAARGTPGPALGGQSSEQTASTDRLPSMSYYLPVACFCP